MPIHRDREPRLDVGQPRVVIQAMLKENERELLAERRGRAETRAMKMSDRKSPNSPERICYRYSVTY